MKIGRERRTIAVVDIGLCSIEGDTVEYTGDVRIEVFLPVEALVSAAKDVPAQPGGYGQILRRVIGVLDKSRIVGI